MAEQFAFQKRFRNGGHVDGDERSRRAMAFGVDRLGQVLLADPGFAQEKHAGIAGDDLAGFLQEKLHLAAVGGEVVEPGQKAAPLVKTVRVIVLAARIQSAFEGFHKALGWNAGIQDKVDARCQQLGLLLGGFLVVQDNGYGVFRQIVEQGDAGLHGLGNQRAADNENVGAASCQRLPGEPMGFEKADLDIQIRHPCFQGRMDGFFLDGASQSNQHWRMSCTGIKIPIL